MEPIDPPPPLYPIDPPVHTPNDPPNVPTRETDIPPWVQPPDRSTVVDYSMR